jgi:hypothetical protein
MSTVVWIVMTLWLVGSIELVRAATSGRSTVTVRERHVRRPIR